jgi:hypothetical protein
MTEWPYNKQHAQYLITVGFLVGLILGACAVLGLAKFMGF